MYFVEEVEKEVIMMNVIVNNLPEYAKDKKYIVARNLDGELWFWGAWDDSKKADEVAHEINGIVVYNN